MPTPATKLIREESTIMPTAKPPRPSSPTESEIATLAYRLWQDNGCPARSDKEDWFRAEAMLKNALVAKAGPGSVRLPSDICDDNRIGLDIRAEFRGGGTLGSVEK